MQLESGKHLGVVTHSLRYATGSGSEYTQRQQNFALPHPSYEVKL